MCGIRAMRRSNLLDHIRIHNPVNPIAFIDVPSQSVQSIIRSHSNETEAHALNVLIRCLILHGQRILQPYGGLLVQEPKPVVRAHFAGLGGICGQACKAARDHRCSKFWSDHLARFVWQADKRVSRGPTQMNSAKCIATKNVPPHVLPDKCLLVSACEPYQFVVTRTLPNVWP